MTRPLALLLTALLAAAAVAAQEPADPVEPPVEPPVETTDEEAVGEQDDPPPAEEDEEEGEAELQEESIEPDGPLTPEEIERERKRAEEAAERAAKREARRIRRAEKKAAEEAKQAEKVERQGIKLADQIATLIGEGHALRGEGDFKEARQRFRKANELAGGSSWEGRMGLAQTELAEENYALAVREAQGAVRSTTDSILKAEALTFAGNVTLAARPTTTSAYQAAQAGIDMYEAAALRYFMRAVTTAPDSAGEARVHIERRFPSREPSPQIERLMVRYLAPEEVPEELDEESGDEVEVETVPETVTAHARRSLLAYEAQLTRRVPADKAVAVVGTIEPPLRTGGPGVEFTPAPGEETRRRLVLSFEVDVSGRVHNVAVLNSVNESLDAAATRALAQWTYEPARLADGQPIRVFWLAAVNVKPAAAPPDEETTRPEPVSPGPGR